LLLLFIPACSVACLVSLPMHAQWDVGGIEEMCGQRFQGIVVGQTPIEVVVIVCREHGHGKTSDVAIVVGRAIEDRGKSLRDDFVGPETSCAGPEVVDPAFVDGFAPASIGLVLVLAWFAARGIVPVFAAAAAADFAFRNVHGRVVGFIFGIAPSPSRDGCTSSCRDGLSSSSWLLLLLIFCSCNSIVQTAPPADATSWLLLLLLIFYSCNSVVHTAPPATSFRNGVADVVATATTTRCGGIVQAGPPAASP